MSKEFKAGDKVYCPKLSRKVLVPQETTEGFGYYPLTVSMNGTHYCFTSDGRYSTLDEVPSFHHATPENHALLEQLYGVEFEKPPVEPSSREIIQTMLDRGCKYVTCWASHLREKPNYSNAWVFICSVSERFFTDGSGTSWQYATPFDPRTGKPITELPE